MAVAGSKFDPALLPALTDLTFHCNEPIARAAIEAVRRTRLVSYIERGILPPSALRAPDRSLDQRDDSCIHLILHRGNCLFGAIRCQFHRTIPGPKDPQPLFREMMERSRIGEADIRYVQNLMETGDTSHTYCETSSWLANPDLRKNTSFGMFLPAAVWGFCSALGPFPGIATLRASNKAAAVLAHFGGQYVRHGEREMRFDDPFYRGPVQLMRMYSQTFHPDIALAVDACRASISRRGVLLSA